ncbi:MAG TPA: uroporphyrinogen-III C-methyltransferase [Firmicutes bacterium]|nr:uroporphyrinogen-III C-methyltransferase [Bacillota bacterium]
MTDKVGKVVLVGAGPGDPGLLTVKGRECLQKAETVVYDRLVSPEILSLIPAQAERIDVGKESGSHPVPQEQINQILAQKALEGRYVVRLKGGDPFVFGRGGEELEILSDKHLDFEVVPGISSSIAAPAYAGIPLTHRAYASSFHVITAHAKAGAELDIPFAALKEAGGTLVFLMGTAALEKICAGLLDVGMAPDTPAAVVENGTTPWQRKVVSSLGHLAADARKARIASPAVIIVGTVCTLSSSFDWHARLPLTGKTLTVTGLAPAADQLSIRLAGLGARIVRLPCLEIRPYQQNPLLDAALCSLQDYQWLVFTSRTGVSVFFTRLYAAGMDARDLFGVRIAVVGSKTAEALREYGVHPDFIPERPDAVSLGQGLCTLAGSGTRALLCRAKKSSPALLKILSDAGILFEDIPLYDTLVPSASEGKAIQQAVQADYILFASGSAVEGFAQITGKTAGVRAVCMGHSAAETAVKLGMEAYASAEASLDSLTDKLLELCRDA